MIVNFLNTHMVDIYLSKKGRTRDTKLQFSYFLSICNIFCSERFQFVVFICVCVSFFDWFFFILGLFVYLKLWLRVRKTKSISNIGGIFRRIIGLLTTLHKQHT